VKQLATAGRALLCLVVLASCTTSADARARRQHAAANAIDFFIHGHEDDWQIFMSPAAYRGAQLGEPIVFIYATAGDAGNTNPNYWQAREAAATASQSVISGQPFASSSWACDQQDVKGHSLRRCSHMNFVAYFLRAPDGSRDGCGYEVHQHQSLSRLMGGVCTPPDPTGPMNAIDGSTSYTTWPDFWQTLRAIIEQETLAHRASSVWINAPDYDTGKNPNDHPDHVAAGQAVKCAADGGGAKCGDPAIAKEMWNTRWYVGYDIMNRPKNATPGDFTTKSGMYMAYDREMWDQWDSKQTCKDGPCHSTMCSDYARYSDWLFRLYSRTGP
jgi:hypothetical protein